MKDHPIIQFKPSIVPLLAPKLTKGMLVGEYLVVSYATPDLNKPTYTIYNVQGRRLFKASYSTIDDAVEMAEWLDGLFSEFFPIWGEYPDADVFGLARWSIQNGIKIYETIKEKTGAG